jgi:hypothetical protein
MKDFDAERRQRDEEGRDDRTFTIGGETFVVKPEVRPEALADYEQMTGSESAHEALRVIDDLVVSFLDDTDDDPEGRYRAVRARTEDPIGMATLESLVEWLVETQTNRPTGRPGSSGTGPQRTKGGSTDGSSSPVSLAATGA